MAWVRFAFPFGLLVLVLGTGCGGPERRFGKELARMGYSLSADELVRAAGEGDGLAVGLFFKAGFPVDARDAQGNTALIGAATFGHFELVEDLLRRGADLNLRGQFQRNALLRASDRGHLEVAHLLLRNGADTAARDEQDWLAITAAAYRGHGTVVEMLARSDSRHINDALLVAAVAGRSEVAEILCREGADVEVRDRSGQTPVMIAAREGHAGVVSVLMGNGANLRTVDDFGASLLDLARGSGDEATIEMVTGEGSNQTRVEPEVIDPAKLVLLPTRGTGPGTMTEQREHGIEGDSEGAWEAAYGGAERREPVAALLHPAKGLPVGFEGANYPVARSSWPTLQGQVLTVPAGQRDDRLEAEIAFRMEGAYAVVRWQGQMQPFEARRNDHFQVERSGGGKQTYRVAEVSARRLVLENIVTRQVIFVTRSF